MANQNVIEITDGNFDEQVMNSSQPVLVDFTAEWCPPCKLLAPTIDKLANDYTNRVKVGKIDIDANRNVTLRFQVSSIPTVIVFKDGQMRQKFVGLKKEADLKAALDSVL
jgi:thioredoxin 1